MNITEARAILERHNKWRRNNDDGVTEPPDSPTMIGLAIDVVLECTKPSPAIRLPHALAILRSAAETHGTNSEIHHNAGDDAQANLCLDVQAECNTAIKLLGMLQ